MAAPIDEAAELPATPAAAPRQKAVLTIGEALAGHRNSLGLIRLVLAALVIVDHAFPIGGYGKDPFWALTDGQASLGSIAVLGFFVISGYLIAKSAMSADLVQFLWRRTLRIFPAYWLVLIVTAFIVAPVIWVLGGEGFSVYFNFSPTGPVAYVLKNLTLEIGTYGIYDLLADTTPYGHEVNASVFNGSLWTLIYEWQCYLMIGVLAVFGVLSKTKVVVPLLAAFLAGVQFMAMVDPEAVRAYLPLLADPQRLALTFAFLLGSSIAVYSKQIPFDDRLGFLSGIVVLLTLWQGGFAVLGYAAGAYFVLYLAVRLPRKAQRIGAKNDYSYGVYIYGFLVQQVLAYFDVHLLGVVPFVLIALIVTFGCAWVSWHLVERRAMALKDWGPGRGVQFWYDKVRARRALRKARN